MKLAVMQPYLFPYIGYFHLINAADLFLIYDDVSFIKQGYINRNSILAPNGVIRFTVPVIGASSNKLISELTFSTDISKVLKTLEQSYSKAPYFKAVFPIIRGTLEHKNRSIASVCQESYEAILSYLGLEVAIKRTSEIDYDRTLSAQKRLIALCHKFSADTYVNAPGGKALYSKEKFLEKGIDLRFVSSKSVIYSQSVAEFVPNLSIIDVLMNCSRDEVICLMQQYELD